VNRERGGREPDLIEDMIISLSFGDRDDTAFLEEIRVDSSRNLRRR
jgi:hypothetical protein